jgi:hypothetical protein
VGRPRELTRWASRQDHHPLPRHGEMMVHSSRGDLGAELEDLFFEVVASWFQGATREPPRGTIVAFAGTDRRTSVPYAMQGRPVKKGPMHKNVSLSTRRARCRLPPGLSATANIER